MWAPYNTPNVLGSFIEKDYGKTFEYIKAPVLPFGDDYPHRIFVGPSWNEGQYRYAKVLRTVAHVVVDEAADGSPVVEKWNIKAHREYLDRTCAE